MISIKITKFKVENRKIKIINRTNLTGQYNVDKFSFEFDDEWDNLNKTLIIKNNTGIYNVPLLYDNVILPNETYTKEQYVEFGLYGNLNNETILVTIPIKLLINNSLYEKGKEPDNLPTPTMWDLYIAEINKLLKSCQLSEEACEEALADLIELKDETLLKMEALKEETQNFRDETQVIADGVKDMATAIQLPMWYVDENLKLHQVTATKLNNLSFRLENGKFIERVVKQNGE